VSIIGTNTVMNAPFNLQTQSDMSLLYMFYFDVCWYVLTDMPRCRKLTFVESLKINSPLAQVSLNIVDRGAYNAYW